MALNSETEIQLTPILRISTTKEPLNGNFKSFKNFVYFILCLLCPKVFFHYNIFSQVNLLGKKVQIVAKSVLSR